MDLGELVVSINGDNSGLNKALKSSTQSVDQAIGQIVGAIGLGSVAFKGLELAANGIKFNAMMETAQTSFGIMLGSVDEAKQKLKDLKYLADHSPLTFTGVTAATTTLLQFGVAGDKVIPTVRMLGDVAGGNEERMQRLSLAFAQVSAAGKIQGQDLLQMINAGYNPLMTISAKTGESMMELRKRMSDGGISADEVAEAFQRVTSKGGQFYGMLEANSKTLTGSFSTLRDATDTFLGRTTEAFSGPLLAGVKGITALLNVIPGQFSAIALTVATVTAGVGAFALGASALAPAFLALGVTINFALLPLLAVTAAVAAIGAAIFVVSNEVDKLNKEHLDQTKKRFGDILEGAETSFHTMEKLVEIAAKLPDKFSESFKHSKNFESSLVNVAEHAGLTEARVAAILLASEETTQEAKNLAREYLTQNGLTELGRTTAEALKSNEAIRLKINQDLTDQIWAQDAARGGHLKKDYEAKQLDDQRKKTQVEMIADLKVWDAMNAAGIKTDSDWLNAKIDIREKIVESITEEALKRGIVTEEDKKGIKVQQDAIAGYKKALVEVEERLAAQKVALDALNVTNEEIIAKATERATAEWNVVEALKAASSHTVDNENKIADALVKEATGRQIVLGYQNAAIANQIAATDRAADYQTSIEEIAIAWKGVQDAMGYASDQLSSLAKSAAKFGNTDLSKILSGMAEVAENAGKLAVSLASQDYVSAAVSGVALIADVWSLLWGAQTDAQKKYGENQAKLAEEEKKREQDRLDALEDLVGKYEDFGKSKREILRKNYEEEIRLAKSLKASTDDLNKITDVYEKNVADNLSDIMKKYEDAKKTRVELLMEESLAELKAAQDAGATYEQRLTITKSYQDKITQAEGDAAKEQADIAEKAAKEQADIAAKKAADIAAAEKVIQDGYRKTGDTILNVMTNALGKGLSETDFSKSIMDTLKGMAIDAAILAGGFADKFKAIGQTIAEALKDGFQAGEISSIKGSISALYASASADVSNINKLFDVPGFAGGTMSAPGGLALVGERGPEIVNLPRGSQVMPNDQTQRALSGGKTINISVQSNAPLDPLQTARVVRETMESLAFQGVA